MAVIELGTNANDSLQVGLTFKPGFNSGMATADVAAVQQAIKDDLGNAHAIQPGAFSYDGLLYVPNRGILRILPGDVVAVDPTGWPILVSKYAIANGPWTVSN